MSKLSQEMRVQPLTLGLITTLQCTAACAGCCFECTPRRTERMQLDAIFRYIAEAKAIGTKVVIFSGGECFLLRRELEAAISYAHRHGLINRCVTNGYWATNYAVAHATLERLRLAGLDEVNFSTGDAHSNYIPPTRVIDGTRAALDLGMRCAVAVEMRSRSPLSKRRLLSHPRLRETLKDPKKKALLIVEESPWIPAAGASRQATERRAVLDSRNLAARKRCESILSTVAVMPSANMLACCGLTSATIPELNLGSLRQASMADLYEDAVADIIKVWLYVEGPERILAWAARKDAAIRWEGMYAHACEACRAVYRDPRVRRIIRDNYEERVADVYFRFSLLTHQSLATTKGCGTLVRRGMSGTPTSPALRNEQEFLD